MINALTGSGRIGARGNNDEGIAGVATIRIGVVAYATVIGVSVQLSDLILQFGGIRPSADDTNKEWIFRIFDHDFFNCDAGVSGGELDGIDQAVLGVLGIHVRRWFDGVSQIFEQGLIGTARRHWLLRGTTGAVFVADTEFVIAEKPD